MPDEHATDASPTWTIDDIASYYRRSPRSARRIVASPGFPPPLQGDARRWSASRVRAWAEGRDERGTYLEASVARGSRIVRRRSAA